MLSRPDFDEDETGGAVAAGGASSASRDALTVSELNARVRGLIERGFPLLSVRGEISNFTRAASGHLYFTLKDSTAQVRCAMWRARAGSLEFSPSEGDAVEVRARASLFEARGEYQLNIESMRRAGAGTLYEAFSKLKDKLAKEGLFDAARKRPLPAFPQTIGVITSLKAAALRDVLTALKRRAPMTSVIVYPVPVQGENAGVMIARALEAASARGEADVLILTRGGGSIEDLWAFNQELVARAIVLSRIPVITGVGHETDFTIADFAADLRAPTPTAAAELASPTKSDLVETLVAQASSLGDLMRGRVAHLQQRLDFAARELKSPFERLVLNRLALKSAAQSLSTAFAHHVSDAQRQLERAQARFSKPETQQARANWSRAAARLSRAHADGLRARREALARASTALTHLNPQGVLSRGYALARDAQGRIVQDAAALQSGDALTVQFARGAVKTRVEGSAD